MVSAFGCSFDNNKFNTLQLLYCKLLSRLELLWRHDFYSWWIHSPVSKEITKWNEMISTINVDPECCPSMWNLIRTSRSEIFRGEGDIWGSCKTWVRSTQEEGGICATAQNRLQGMVSRVTSTQGWPFWKVQGKVSGEDGRRQ